jgi:hypothetical protein
MLAMAIAGCSSESSHRAASPTSPSDNAAATSEVTITNAADEPIDPSRPLPGRPGGPASAAADVSFPPRDQALAFRQELEATYRDVLHRTATASFVDVEGDIVWTTEYLRYRVNGCSNADAISRVQAQIQGGSAQPVCAAFTGTIVDFPPRNEPFAFRVELERVYRDVLRRSANQVFVDAEGDIVWTTEYLRYRVNNCSHSEAVQRVVDEVRGSAPVQTACGTVPAPSGGVSDFLAGISSDDSGPATLVSGGRPNAGAGPIITAAGNGTLSGGINQITLNASQPIDTVIISVDDDGSSSPSNRSMAIADSYYVLRLRTPRTAVIVNLDLPGRAIGRGFSLQFAGSNGGGPLGPYVSRPVMVQRCSYSVSPTAVTIGVMTTGAFDVMVDTMPMCRWTPSSPSSFILAGPPSIGPGIARFGYLFASTPRTGVVRISFVAPPGEPSFIDIPVAQR